VAEVRTHRGDASGDGGRRETVGPHRGQPGLELVHGRLGNDTLAERTERGEITPVGVDRSR
jgi:hypothetical protein